MGTFKPILKGIGTALPAKTLTNDELLTRFAQFDLAPFLKITGIQERRVLPEGKSASDLAIQAAESLFQTGFIDRSEIDTLIYVSLTADYRTPPTSCVLQNRLGLRGDLCSFDMVQACPAFIHELATVHGLLASGTSKTVLAIHSDTLSQIIHPKDRELVPIHGDGAVALVYQAEKTEGTGTGLSIDWFSFGTNGAQADRIIVPEGMSRKPMTAESLKEKTDESGNVRSASHLKMDGAAVFHFVIHTIPGFLRTACAEHQVSLEDYDLILFHQANKMIVDMLYNMLKIPMSKRFYFLEKVGNMSGVTLPFMLAEALRAGKVKPGAKLLLCGFGAGLSWGAVSLRWQDAPCALPETAILS